MVNLKLRRSLTTRGTNLDTQNVSSGLRHFRRQIHVVVDRVLGLAGVRHIPSVRDCSFHDSACLACSVNTELTRD